MKINFSKSKVITSSDKHIIILEGEDLRLCMSCAYFYGDR